MYFTMKGINEVVGVVLFGIIPLVLTWKLIIVFVNLLF